MSKSVFSRLFRGLYLSAVSVFLTLIIISGCFIFLLTLQLPNVKKLDNIQLQIPLKIYSSDKKLIGEFGNKKRTPVSLAQIPKNIIQAIIDTEDKRFYQHSGIDIISLLRATKVLFITGEKRQGAGTITMQVARNFLLSHKKTYTRKFKEVLLAIKIDREFSKNEILSLYLNKVYFGEHAYGVAAASRVYYGKPLNQLTLPEMAMIAGLPKAPSKDNPIVNPEAAIKRRNHVLECMEKCGDISQATYEQAILAPITAKYHHLKIELNAPFVAEMVRKEMFKKFGEKAYENGYVVYTTINSKLQKDANKALKNGLIAYTKRHGYRKTGIHFTKIKEEKLDKYFTIWEENLKKIPTVNGIMPSVIVDMQEKTITALLSDGQKITLTLPFWVKPILGDNIFGRKPEKASDIFSIGDVIRVRKIKDGWVLSQIPNVTGGLVALNPNNGAILALTGGFSYKKDQFNNVTQAYRQPGSAFKPFIYSAALEKGFTLASLVNDAPIVMADSGINQLWRPENSSHKFYGPTRLRIGLIKSRNLVSIRLLQNIGIPYAIDYVKKFGFSPSDLPKALSLALGSGNTTPLQLIRAYATFANGGYLIKPFFIEQIRNENNKIIFENPEINKENNRIITPENAYLITDALKDVIKHGTGKKALILKRNDLAGKTGTTNNQIDAWFSGFNKNLVVTVWVGFQQSKSLHEYGAQAALPIWIDFMKLKHEMIIVKIDPETGLKNKPEESWDIPVEMIIVRIDPEQGFVPEGKKH